MIRLVVSKSLVTEVGRLEDELAHILEYRLPRWAYNQSEWFRDGTRINKLKREIRKLREL